MYANVTYRRPSTGLSDDAPGVVDRVGSGIGSVFTGVGNLVAGLAPLGTAATNIAMALRRPTQYPDMGSYNAPRPVQPPPYYPPSFDWTPVLLVGGAGLIAAVIFLKKR